MTARPATWAAGTTAVPADVEPFVQVSPGLEHSCGVRASGALDCWGYDAWGSDATGQVSVPSAPDREGMFPATEPASDFWRANGGQECCGFDRPSQSQLIGILRASLDAKGLAAVGIAASDETSIDMAVDSYNALTPAVRNQIVQINTHAYSGSKRGELLALAKRDGKRLWSSEITTFVIAGVTP